MTEQEMLERDIQTLKTSLNLDARDLASLGLTNEEAAGIREHIRLCMEDLNKLEAETRPQGLKLGNPRPIYSESLNCQTALNRSEIEYP